MTTGVWAVHRLVYPFFGTDVLGGFTMFSACAVDVRHLLREGYVRTGLACLVPTVAVVLAAVWCGAAVTPRLAVRRRARRGRPGRASTAVLRASVPRPVRRSLPSADIAADLAADIADGVVAGLGAVFTGAAFARAVWV
ncbi:hypothetical protein [Streptomyces iranensis]|uniref:hypothetical protein n=1 Tax=Streptomyces iranensis TaxID=576784 RepID=UPI0039B75403